MPNQPAVKTEITDHVMLITLNRPASLNAISPGLVDGIVSAFGQAETSSDVNAIVITGAGKAFCAGVDLKVMSASDGNSVLDNDGDLIAAFENCTKPLIGAINGAAFTGGLELALHCDFLYACDSARFGDTHAKVGLMPTWGMSQKLSRIIGINRAREMSLSGGSIDAQTALNWGLVNKVCDADSLLNETLKKAKEIAANKPDAVAGIRMLMNTGWRKNLKNGLQLEDKNSRPFNDKVDFSVMLDRLNQVKKSNR